MRKASITLVAVACFGSSAFGASPISALEGQVAGLRAEVKSLQTQLTVIQQNNALKLGPFVTVDPNPENNVIGPNIVSKGANIHIESGSGATDDNGTLLSLGNRFIAYNEPAQASLNSPPD